MRVVTTSERVTEIQLRFFDYWVRAYDFPADARAAVHVLRQRVRAGCPSHNELRLSATDVVNNFERLC